MQRMITMSRTMVFLALLAALVAALVDGTKPAYADTLTVTNTADPGNGVCDANCTLREAIDRANELDGPDTIHFNIPGTGVQTIEPGSELPAITEQVTINGYSQPETSPNNLAFGTNAELMIELSGQNAGNQPIGLTIMAPNVVVKGLVINSFAGAGIGVISDAVNTRIEGNFIGTDPTGTQALGNGEGVVVQTPDNIVGGNTEAARNLISGNKSTGVRINGLVIDGNRVQGNLIGTTASGSGDLGNHLFGVHTNQGSNTIVGGSTAEAANTIAFNDTGVAVELSTATGNRILRNSIFSNDKLGIDLGLDGPTPNDPGDTDTGPNGLQNKPALTSATTTAKGATTIKGKLNSKPNKTFIIQFFRNVSGGQGKKFIGQKKVSTACPDNKAHSKDCAGKVSFTFKPANKVAVGHNVTATATGAQGTSEFSAPRTVTVS